MNGDNESTNPARDLSINAKPATHARGAVPLTRPSSEIEPNQDSANKQHDDRLSDTQVKNTLEIESPALEIFVEEDRLDLRLAYGSF